MALLQMQNEEVQMRMQDSTAAVVDRQDMLHGRQQKPAMPNEQYPIKYDELWIYENTLITDHEVAPKITFETPAQHCSSAERQCS